MSEQKLRSSSCSRCAILSSIFGGIKFTTLHGQLLSTSFLRFFNCGWNSNSEIFDACNSLSISGKADLPTDSDSNGQSSQVRTSRMRNLFGSVKDLSRYTA